jgi:hypothetical protein
MEDIAQYIQKKRGDSGIVYCTSRKDCEKVSDALGKQLGNRRLVTYYHAKLSPEERADRQRKWSRGQVAAGRPVSFPRVFSRVFPVPVFCLKLFLEGQNVKTKLGLYCGFSKAKNQTQTQTKQKQKQTPVGAGWMTHTPPRSR